MPIKAGTSTFLSNFLNLGEVKGEIFQKTFLSMRVTTKKNVPQG